MAKKEFQAESKKLMDMMINSIYTNKEIFLRELISNASDAIDKLYYKSLTDTSVGMNKGDFRILITRDKENRILTVEDNGIGMTKEELEQNLGTIAHSGSLDFKKDNKDENIDIIGQFGVGFYSAFMVADKLTVISKAYGSDEAWQWESSGVDGYEMTPAQKDTVGTQIILHIKPDTDTEQYDNFLVTRRVMLWAFLTAVPLMLLTDGMPDLTPLFTQTNVLLSWLFLGVFGNAVCFAIWNIAFKRLGVVITNNYLYASPFVTLVVGYLLLDEQITAMSVLGAVLITAGVIVALKKPKETV